MSQVISVAADSIFLGRARRPGSNGNEVSLAAMNFVPLLADTLVRDVLRLSATPSNMLVGVEDEGTVFRVSVFAVFTIQKPVHPALVPKGATPPYLFVIGNESQFGRPIVQPFLDGVRHDGFFSLGCGYHPLEKGGTLASGWTIRLTTVCYHDAHLVLQGMVEKELGTLP